MADSIDRIALYYDRGGAKSRFPNFLSTSIRPGKLYMIFMAQIRYLHDQYVQKISISYCSSSRNMFFHCVKIFQVIHCLSLNEEGYLNEFGSFVISIQHLPDQFSVCLALSTGDVLLWSTTTRMVSSHS